MRLLRAPAGELNIAFMRNRFVTIACLALSLGGAVLCHAQGVSSTETQPTANGRTRELLGLKLRPEIALIVKEIEAKTRKQIYAYFEDQPQYQLGASYIDDDGGMAVISVDPELQEQPKKLEAVITHELLHLRLTVNGYPSYLWSPKVRTAEGRAIDVAQGTINELRSIIEHRVFRDDMIKFDLYRYIDLAGDTLAEAKKRRGNLDGQVETINYVRAILEYSNPKDIAAVKQVYTTNGWRRSIKDGTDIAALIDRTVVAAPKDIETLFLNCVAKLYPPPSAVFAFSLTNDPTNRYFRRMILNVGRVSKK